MKLPSAFQLSNAPTRPRDRRRHAIRVWLLAGAVVGMLSIGPAWSQEATAPAQDQPDTRLAVEGEVNKNGKVCKREDVTGSRMPKRVCYTPEQWEARQRAAREAVREMDARQVGKDALGG